MLPQQMQHNDVFRLKTTGQTHLRRPTLRQNGIDDFLCAASFQQFQIV
jgi:hypothetical protein